MFDFGKFSSHSGLDLSWKINCDSLSDSDWQSIAELIASRFMFKQVIGIPYGGLKLQFALEQYVRTDAPGLPILIVDDVLTTGNSMQDAREKFKYKGNVLGITLFSRAGKDHPSWILPIFTLGDHWQ